MSHSVGRNSNCGGVVHAAYVPLGGLMSKSGELTAMGNGDLNWIANFIWGIAEVHNGSSLFAGDTEQVPLQEEILGTQKHPETM